MYGYIFCAFVLMNLKTTKRERAQHFPNVKLKLTLLQAKGIETSTGRIVLYEGNNLSQDVVCNLEWSGSVEWNFKETGKVNELLTILQ